VWRYERAVWFQDSMKNSASTLSLPNPTPWLLLAATALAWITLGPGGDLRVWPFAVLLSPLALAAVYVFARRTEVAALTLIAAGAASRFHIELGGLNVRGEYIVIGMLCLSVPFILKRRTTKEHWILPDYLLLTYVALNFTSSLVMSISPPQTVKWALEQAVVVLAYFLLRVFVKSPEVFKRAVHFLAAVSAVGGACGVLSFYSNLLFGTTFGVDLEQYQTIPATHGIMYEANILGAFSAAGLVLALVLYFKERRKLFLYEAALAYAGMAVSVSRGVIIACVIVAAASVIVLAKARLLDWSGMKAAAATLIVTSLIVGPAMVPLYVERFSKLDASDITSDSETTLRLVTMAVAYEDIKEHPVLGNGTSSFQLSVTARELGLEPASDDVAMWISNFELRVLHDTGVIGFAAFCAFLASLTVLCWRLLRREQNAEVQALLLSGLVYCFTFQATEGTLLAFSWVHLGLLACALSIYTPRKDENSLAFGTSNPASG
jgi:hypothetical protein